MLKSVFLYLSLLSLIFSCIAKKEQTTKGSGKPEICKLKIFNHFQLDSILCSISHKGKKLPYSDPENDFILVTFYYNKDGDTLIDFSYEKFRPAIMDESMGFKKYINQKDIKMLIVDNVDNPAGERFYNFKHFKNDNDTIFEKKYTIIDDTPYERIRLKFQIMNNAIISRTNKTKVSIQ